MEFVPFFLNMMVGCLMVIYIARFWVRAYHSHRLCWNDQTAEYLEAAGSGNVAGQMPEDVLAEILSRLPVKSLLRFRSVCKHWRSLIQDPSFVLLHHNRVKKNSNHDYLLFARSLPIEPILEKRILTIPVGAKAVLNFFSIETPTPLVQDIDENFSAFSSSMLVYSLQAEYVELLGPCNGLVCIADPDDEIVLCNPATREFRTLPAPPFSYRENTRFGLAVAGFGFDPKSNDYKLVRILQVFIEHSCFLRAMIYDLSLDSWREVDPIMPNLGFIPSRNIAALCNGAFHWAGRSASEDGSYSDLIIISFDLMEEEFHLIQLGNGLSVPDHKSNIVLLVLNESLALLSYEFIGMPSMLRMSIWVMTEYGVRESWTKRFSIGPLSGVRWPLAFWKDGDELLLRNFSSQLVSCNLRTEDIKEFQFPPPSEILQVFPYAEGLTSIERCSYLGRRDNRLI